MSVKTRTVADLKFGVAGLLSGTNLNQVTSLNNALERALRTFSQKASIPEASTSQNITLYDGIFDYAAVSPLFGSSIKDARPIGQSRMSDDYVEILGSEDFDRKKSYPPSGYRIAFETINGVNRMRVATNRNFKRIVLDPMSGTTGWSTGGIASVLTEDDSVYYRAPASLRFTLTGAGSGYIEKTLTSSVDLTKYQSVGVGFLALDLPVLNLSSVELRIGSDSTNYYSVSVAQGFLGSWSINDFLDTPFDLSLATKTGNPVITAMKYVRLTFTTTATITNIRCGYLFIALPSQHRIFFSTTGIFSHNSVISNFITDDNDTILLSDATYNIYEHECAITVALQNGGSLSGGIIGSINSLLNGARARNGAVLSLGMYDRYRADNPSQDIRLVGNWYDD